MDERLAEALKTARKSKRELAELAALEMRVRQLKPLDEKLLAAIAARRKELNGSGVQS